MIVRVELKRYKERGRKREMSSNTAASSPVNKEQPRLRWESPSSARSLDAVLTVPYSGFYSVAFGHASKIHCQRKSGNKKRKRTEDAGSHVSTNAVVVDDTAAAAADDDDAAIKYSLVIKRPQDDDDGTAKDDEHAQGKETKICEETRNDMLELVQVCNMPLPWQEPDGNPQLLHPPSVFLGKVVWIDQQSQLSICRKQLQQHGDQSTSVTEKASDNCDNNDNEEDEDDGNPLQWHVRLQGVPRCRPKNTSPRKPWACNICGKTFANALGVSQHQDTAHNDQVNETTSCLSIWTTPLSVVYDDDYLAVVIKPQGMAVQGDKDGQTLQRSSLLMPLLPTRGSTGRTKLKLAWPQQKIVVPAETLDANGNEKHGDKNNNDQKLDSYLGKPRPVHRLDAPTGGLLVVAKTRRTESALKLLFEDRYCHKTYRALAYGNIVQDEGECSQDLSGKPSLTRYRVLRRTRSITSPDGWLSTVELYPHTGRQHQIRKHLQMMGHPLWGDRRYYCGPKQTTNRSSWQSRLCLWAIAIKFPHPATGEEVSCRMSEPEWLQQVVQHEEEKWRKANPSQAS